MKILDLAWASWVLIIVSLIAGGAWLGWGFWWLRHNSAGKKFFRCADNTNNSQALILETKSLQQKSPINNAPKIIIKPIVFSENPEKIMWRPPPRESLLHRQQIKVKLGRPEDRLDGQRPRLSKTPLPIASYPPPQVTTNNTQLPLVRIAAPDSKIGRKRQGLESLVNLSPPEETEEHHDARNS